MVSEKHYLTLPDVKVERSRVEWVDTLEQLQTMLDAISATESKMVG